MATKATIETLEEWLRQRSPVLTSADAIARTFKVSKSTAAAWLADLKSSGRVTYQKQGRSGGIVTWVEKSDDSEIVQPLKKASGSDDSNRPNRTARIVQPIAQKSQMPAVLDELKLVQSEGANRPKVAYLPWVDPDDSRTNAVVPLDDSESSDGRVEVTPEIVQPAPEASGPATQPTPFKLHLRDGLPILRPANGLRLVSSGAIIVSIIMIAVHSATSSAASPFHWYATLAMAIILSTGKVVLGSQAEAFLSDGERRMGFICMAGAVFLLAADASLLYAFRGDSLSNAAAQEQAAMESRERIKARLDNLLAEQRALTEAETSGTPAPVLAASGPVRVASTGTGDCRKIPAPWFRGQPEPAVPPLQVGDCSAELNALALNADLQRAKVAASQVERAAAAAERRAERLAKLPALIEAAETELATTHARASSDHGASIVARGLNWIPAGISAVVWGEEFRPVGGRGVEIFWSWVFVLGVEIFAVGGFAVAARADRHSRKRLTMETA